MWEGVEMVSSGQGGSMAEKIKFVTDFEAFFLGIWGGLRGVPYFWGRGLRGGVPGAG